jgi:hypothetical protein
MKKVLLSAVVLAGLPLYAAKTDLTPTNTTIQTITFKNENTEEIKLIIKNGESGELIEKFRLRTGHLKDFTLTPDTTYTIEAEEPSGSQLKTGIFNLSLRPRYTTGDVIVSRTTPFLSRTEVLTFTGKNAKVRQPWTWRNPWAKPATDMPQ